MERGIFAKQMARKLKLEELDKVGGGGFYPVGTYDPNSCSVDGGTDGVFHNDGTGWLPI